MSEMVRNGQDSERDGTLPKPSGAPASQGSDTDSPPVSKLAGLDGGDAGGSDTDGKEGTKTGLGED